MLLYTKAAPYATILLLCFTVGQLASLGWWVVQTAEQVTCQIDNEVSEASAPVGGCDHPEACAAEGHTGTWGDEETRGRMSALLLLTTCALASGSVVQGAWSIGVYKGKTPFSLQPLERLEPAEHSAVAWPVANPVLTCASLGDTPSNFGEQ